MLFSQDMYHRKGDKYLHFIIWLRTEIKKTSAQYLSSDNGHGTGTINLSTLYPLIETVSPEDN